MLLFSVWNYIIKLVIRRINMAKNGKNLAFVPGLNSKIGGGLFKG